MTSMADTTREPPMIVPESPTSRIRSRMMRENVFALFLVVLVFVNVVVLRAMSASPLPLRSVEVTCAVPEQVPARRTTYTEGLEPFPTSLCFGSKDEGSYIKYHSSFRGDLTALCLHRYGSLDRYEWTLVSGEVH